MRSIIQSLFTPNPQQLIVSDLYDVSIDIKKSNKSLHADCHKRHDFCEKKSRKSHAPYGSR